MSLSEWHCVAHEFSLINAKNAAIYCNAAQLILKQQQ